MHLFLLVTLTGIASVLGWVGFNIVASCEYQNAGLMKEAQLVVNAVKSSIDRDGEFPDGSENGTAVLEGIPPGSWWSAKLLEDGTFVVRHSGSPTTGVGFDAPWVEFFSRTAEYKCYSR